MAKPTYYRINGDVQVDVWTIQKHPTTYEAAIKIKPSLFFIFIKKH